MSNPSRREVLTIAAATVTLPMLQAALGSIDPGYTVSQPGGGGGPHFFSSHRVQVIEDNTHISSIPANKTANRGRFRASEL